VFLITAGGLKQIGIPKMPVYRHLLSLGMVTVVSKPEIFPVYGIIKTYNTDYQ
jgi:hypothetical protein